MRKRILTVVAVAGLFALVVGLVPASASSAVRPSVHKAGRGGAWHTDLTILYNQINNTGGVSLLSQDFTDAGFDVYDSYFADDFAVPGTLTHGWKVQGMREVGVFFNGPGPCDSETVVAYKDAAGLPGATVGTRSGAGVLSGTGTYTLSFASPILLAKGFTYWASMYCTMAYAVGGEWGMTDRVVTSGNSGAWENPGGGFAICPTWTYTDACFGGVNDGDDAQFALAGAAL